MLELHSRSYLLFLQLVVHRIKGKIYRVCVYSVLTYGTETLAMKAENLNSLERTERMMVIIITIIIIRNLINMM